MFLVDTNVVSELMRQAPAPAVVRWAGELPRMTLSVVTVEEVLYGLASKRNLRLERWFNAFLKDHSEVLPVTEPIARRSAALRAQLRAGGRERTVADGLIAATASEHGLIVATRNVRDFAGAGVRVFDPFSAR